MSGGDESAPKQCCVIQRGHNCPLGPQAPYLEGVRFSFPPPSPHYQKALCDDVV